jgi:drug/metabolite transporter (DMT)-like permease
MSWLIFAFAGPVLWAVSTHFDKYLIERFFKTGNVAVFLVFTSFIGFLLMPFIWFFKPGVIDLPLISAAVISVSGILYMGAIYFYLGALQTEEPSMVIPFFQSAAIFGLILGYFVLGEKLTLPQIGGGLLVVAGSVLLSLRFGKNAPRIKRRLVVLMVSAAFMVSLSSLIFKFFEINGDFWTTVFWSYTGDAVFGVVLLSFAANRRQLFQLVREHTGAVLSINTVNELINLGGNLGANYAFLFAPLGVVQAITSTTPFFVLFFGILLTFLFPKLGRENVGFGNITQKIIAIALVVTGVLLINQ